MEIALLPGNFMFGFSSIPYYLYTWEYQFLFEFDLNLVELLDKNNTKIDESYVIVLLVQNILLAVQVE